MKCPLIKKMKFILGKYVIIVYYSNTLPPPKVGLSIFFQQLYTSHSFHFFIHISRDGNGFIV